MNTQLKTLVSVVVVTGLILVIAAVTTPSNQTLVMPQAEAVLTLVGPNGGDIEVGQIQNVQWTSQNYTPKNVRINIIRKVSDNPATYELVRTVSESTMNDGSAVWVPAKTDAGKNVLVEVACLLSPQGCRASESSGSLAVLDTGRYANTASVYNAIEAAENK